MCHDPIIISEASIPKSAEATSARHPECEAAPLGPGLPQGRHARLQEGGEEPRHPESVSAIPRETLICTVLCNVNSLFIADAVSTL